MIGTLIKWPGGKSREIIYIKDIIPDEYDRYVEPFFGGGAMYFYLEPKKALINDISQQLMMFFSLIKKNDSGFKGYLYEYDYLIKHIIDICEDNYSELHEIYIKKRDFSEKADLAVNSFVHNHFENNITNNLILDYKIFLNHLYKNSLDKINRTVKNEQKTPYNAEDLKENLITGFVSGMYMYFREIYNDIALKRLTNISVQYEIANFYFIREYCYGSMFRYNAKGEFNIPYGGMSYNRKDFSAKIKQMFDENVINQLTGTEIYNMDFEKFFNSINLSENDFMFLDPPYDTEFSDYEGVDFTKSDQIRLANALKKTKAKFILIIKNTDFIYSLYKDYFNILYFDKTYTYNVRSRNDRDVEHLIITNLPIN